MKQERTIIGGLLLLQLILWLGFLVHRSPRFPGSSVGWVLAITAALLMVVPPLVYSAAKRIEAFKLFISKKISIGTLLTWHIYTGIAGSILAILHTGHRFESNLGIWLTTMMMLTILSGFIGRYFLSYSSQELREKQDQLNLLATQYNQLIGGLAQKPDPEITYVASHGLVRRAFNSFTGTENFSADTQVPLSIRALRLAESIADLEYAIKTHEFLKRRTARWLYAHIATSCVFYLLLVFHIWSAIYFGLRWFK
ncbi:MULTISPECIES: hypothetical protein [Pontibacter]|uniref:Iron reductase n=1 Tax=Pontibacter actiniarum TaxID=323450 RepID=A0A1X9YYM2_9BACT|nr:MULTISPECIES: hypothetical protein [Pontibacter]ARS37988.1 hypothetical protein CA264_20765 [Pontibacter actiniarum]QCR25321.1 hypothetical protein C1N53_22660 [Pontibacter sp. SGAir0037]